MDITEAVLEDRYDNYGVLSRLFRLEVDSELLAMMIESPTAEASGDEAVDKANARIRAYLDAVDDLSEAKSELAIDYALTFLGYGVDPGVKNSDKNAAYLYESLYTVGSKGFTKAGDSVAKIYEQAGFHYTKDRTVMADHLAHELEYMQFMVGQELLCLRGGRTKDIQKYQAQELDFLNTHLLVWTPCLVKEINRFSKTDFYRTLGDLLMSYLVYDNSQLSVQKS